MCPLFFKSNIFKNFFGKIRILCEERRFHEIRRNLGASRFRNGILRFLTWTILHRQINLISHQLQKMVGSNQKE